MSTDFYITSPSSKFPLDHAGNEDDAAALLEQYREACPGAVAEPTDVYFARMRASTLASFPLSRISRRFYETMLEILPPQYVSGAAGFFMSEAVTQGVHAQFIEYDGQTYGGYADLARSTSKIWTTADIIALERELDGHGAPLDWFPDA